MFGLQKLAVLEQKLDIYEDLSKEMLDKLERAVATISENSNRVAIVLERHENRLEETNKSNTVILKLIDELKTENREDHERVQSKIKELEKKVEKNQTWIIGASAVLATAVTLLQVLPKLGFFLTPPAKAAMIQGVEAPVNVLSRHQIHTTSIPTTGKVF